MSRNLNVTKYRIDSTRLKNRDYSAPGYYFITLCTRNMECLLGGVVRGRMQLSPAGEIVESEWLKSFGIRAELDCDAYCVMPNHVHGIVIIRDTIVRTHGREDPRNVRVNRDHVYKPENVETHGRASLQSDSKKSCPIANRSPKSFSSFVAGFKSAVTVRIGSPIWQPRFYDRIIRNDRELDKIREYVHYNSHNWELDEYHASFSLFK